MKRAEPLRAVTFDFWGTLARDTPEGLDHATRARVAALADIVGDAGVRAGAAAIEAAYERCGVEMTGRFWSAARDCPIETQVRLFLECVEPGLPARLGPERVAAAVAAYESPILRWPPALLPGAEAAIRAVAGRGLAIGLISNTGRTPGRMLRRLLEQFGLLRYFRVLSYSDEVGVRKPAREIFEMTLAGLGVPAAAVLHVGDNPTDDVAGARRAGLRAVHCVAGGRAGGSADADLVITSLAELPGRLGECGA